MAAVLQSTVVLLAGFQVLGSAPCANYGVCNAPAQPPRSAPHALPTPSETYPNTYADYARHDDFVFLPAPPGRTPSCARPGATYCDRLEHYPTYLIRHLAERWTFDHESIFKNESPDELQMRPAMSPPSYPNSLKPGNSTHSINSRNLSNKKTGGKRGNERPRGYPDRRYHLNLEQTHLTYDSATPMDSGLHFQTRSAAPQPPATENFNEPRTWWRAYSRRRRQSTQNTIIELCPTESRFVAPQAALNRQGNWMYIVNLPETDQRHTQLIRLQSCVKVDQECNSICNLPLGYTSRCVQRYVQKRLVALGGKGDRLYTDIFWFPHGCACQVSDSPSRPG